MNDEFVSQVLCGCPFLEDVRIARFYSLESTKLPDILFISKTIVSLERSVDACFHVPSSVHLPCLEVLHFRKVAEMHDKFLDSHLSGCPVLEELYLTASDKNNSMPLRICIPTAYHVEIRLPFRWQPRDYKLEIDAPTIKYFKLPYADLDIEIVGNFSSLQEAYIGFCYHIPRKLLSTPQSTKVLKLRRFNSKSSSLVKVDFIPRFQHLEHLEFTFSVSTAHLLQEILENSDNLQKLIFSKYCDASWPLPLVVPHCLLYSFKAFRIRDFEGLTGEIQMVNYILMRARVSEKVTVSFCLQDPYQKLRVKKKLSAIPRCSSTSDLKFI